MGLWATGMDRYDQMLLLVNRWVTQIDLVASGGPLKHSRAVVDCPLAGGGAPIGIREQNRMSSPIYPETLYHTVYALGELHDRKVFGGHA